eukprot:bmy_04305T0
MSDFNSNVFLTMSYFSLCPLTGRRGPDARLGMELTHENQASLSGFAASCYSNVCSCQRKAAAGRPTPAGNQGIYDGVPVIDLLVDTMPMSNRYTKVMRGSVCAAGVGPSEKTRDHHIICRYVTENTVAKHLGPPLGHSTPPQPRSSCVRSRLSALSYTYFKAKG